MGMVNVTGGTETYLGEEYRLERREIGSLIGRTQRVWCWEVLTGPAKGEFGGKCGTKSEARKWARHAVREIGPEREASDLSKVIDKVALPEGYKAKVQPGDEDYPESISITDVEGNSLDDERASAIIVNYDGTVSWAGSPDIDYADLNEYIGANL